MSSSRLCPRIGRPPRHRWRIFVPVAALLLFSPPCGLTEASAGMSYYSAYPVVGSGYYIDYPLNQLSRFNFFDGSVGIGYDPDNLESSFIYVSSGTAGYSVGAYVGFRVSVSSVGVTFSALEPDGSSASAFFFGDPGPLNSDGIPVSLDYLDAENATAFITGAGGYHDEYYFSGQSIPEPSSIAMLPVGIGFVVACLARSKKKRLGALQLAGR
jgi:hypothetical protein